ncbi:hypothetical protein [Thermogemmatispora carboxidivorans]|uniref:hypothetical protein n=1 Tax=Thermogemmatispora carboxidivorans TaxID=1382306 RepID=UPI00069CB614|nr:hypothetical protein [Thermogemmatispora carboxidivorans]
MNTPFVFGWQQLLLFAIAALGLALLIYAIHGVVRGEKVYYRQKHPYRSEKEAWEHGWYDQPHRRFFRYRRRYRVGHGLGGLVLLLFAILLLWLTSLMQTYIGLTGDIKVAQVRAHPVANMPHTMNVELILYGQDGSQLSDNFYIVAGDEWMLQGDIIKYPSWLNVLGLHSGYKLTRLEGRFDDPNLEANAKHTVVVLNGGDDNFFQTMRTQRGGWLSNFVEASYGNAVFNPADGSYDVFVSQTGLWAKRTSS